MMSFSFSFEDHEEAEIVFSAYAEVARKLKTQVGKRSKKAAPVAEAPTQVDIEDAIADTPPRAKTAAESAANCAPIEPAPVKKVRGKRAAAPAAETPVDTTTEAPAETKLEPVVVRPPTKQPAAARVPVTIEECKSLVAANKDTKDCYGLLAKVLKKHKVTTRLSLAPEEKAAAIHADLTAAFLGDEIAF